MSHPVVLDAPVLVTVEHGVAILTLNRPSAGNTINLPLVQALLQAAIRCDSDASIRCVVLTGAGKLFCGGGDLGAIAEYGENVPAFLSELAGSLHMVVSRLMRMRKPLVVLVNGPAAGAGLSLALIGDVVIAGQAANFTAAYGRVGLSADGGLSWLLPRLIGMRKAQDMIIANRRVDAAEAEAIGLVTRVVGDDLLAEEGAKQAAVLAAGATAAIGAARALLLASYEGSLEGQLELETRSLSALGGTPDFREGAAAFFARRKPDFKGVS
jgi:2-(1,2-epoxy-1,2-dihydrophenyl)acetyl-CoA isomerase